MTYRKRRSLDSQIITSLYDKGGSATWGNILKDIREKDKTVQEKVFWEAMKRLEIEGDIKKENRKYHLAPVIRPFQIIKGQYLFNWDNIPGDDNERLLYFLNKYFEIEWIKKAKIEKIDNANTIRVFADTKSLLLRLNEEKTKVKVEIDDGRTYELTVKIESGKLNVYISHNYTQTLEIWADSICSQENENERVRTLAKYLYRALGNIDSLTLYVFEKYARFQEKDQEKAEEYLDWAVKSIDELIKNTAEKLLTPPKEQKFLVPNSKITKISKEEINRAGRKITATLAKEIPKEVMAPEDSIWSNVPEHDFGFKDYMFNWDEIPGNDNGKLIEILHEDFGIDWITAKIEKIDNGTTIRVYTENNSLSLNLNEQRVKLTINDGRTYEFTAKEETGKLNIYYRDVDKS